MCHRPGQWRRLGVWRSRRGMPCSGGPGWGPYRLAEKRKVVPQGMGASCWAEPRHPLQPAASTSHCEAWASAQTPHQAMVMSEGGRREHTHSWLGKYGSPMGHRRTRSRSLSTQSVSTAHGDWRWKARAESEAEKGTECVIWAHPCISVEHFLDSNEQKFVKDLKTRTWTKELYNSTLFYSYFGIIQCKWIHLNINQDPKWMYCLTYQRSHTIHTITVGSLKPHPGGCCPLWTQVWSECILLLQLSLNQVPSYKSLSVCMGTGNHYM